MKILLYVICAALLLVPASSLRPDEDIKSRISNLIKEEKLDQARAEVDAFLKIHPENVDALMMKGNVILNEAYVGGIRVSGNENESIFDDSIGYIGDASENTIVPEKIAGEVSSYWERCLTLDPSRKDIHMGLCYLYSTALMKDRVLLSIRRLKKAFPKENFAFNMGDYAQNHFSRGDTPGAIAVYREILILYPQESGIYSDLGAVYSRIGNYKEALALSNAALAKSNIDNMVLNNNFMMNLITGNFDKAVDALRKIKGENQWMFFHGLNLYYKNKPEWKSILSEYAMTPGNSPETKIAGFLTSPENKNDYESYLKSMIGNSYVNHFILSKRAMEKFPDSYEPYYRHLMMLAYYKNYEAALAVVSKIEKLKSSLNENQTADFLFLKGWILYDSGKHAESAPVWEKQLNAENLYIQSAACYFYGKCLLKSGNREKALSVFALAAGRSGETKYGMYCRNLSDNLKAGK